LFADKKLWEELITDFTYDTTKTADKMKEKNLREIHRKQIGLMSLLPKIRGYTYSDRKTDSQTAR
jgi:hypothetical protein